MTNPYEPGVELDRADPALDEVAQRLEGYASSAGGEPPSGLTSRILAAIEDEPDPVGRWAWLGTWQGPLRFAAAAGALVIVIVGALAFGTLLDRARDIGSSAPPVPSLPVSPTPSASPSPTVSPSPTDSASPSPSVSPMPSPTHDDRFETPEPGETPEPAETPRPVQSDNSGPGGGGSSGPGGGGSSGSGSDD